MLNLKSHRSSKILKSIEQDLPLRTRTLAAKKTEKHIDLILVFKNFFSNQASKSSKNRVNLRRNMPLIIYS